MAPLSEPQGLNRDPYPAARAMIIMVIIFHLLLLVI